MTDVARRQARTQKQRLDTALLERRRREALAELGENLHDLATRGEIELDELPELVQGIQAVDDIDQEIAEAEQAASASSAGRRPVRLERTRPDRIPPTGRSRERVWRPPVEPVEKEADGEAGTPHVDVDGPEASGGDESGFEAEFATGRRAASTRADSRGGNWARTRSRAREAAETTPERPRRKGGSATPAKGGGIIFVDDESAPADRDPDDSIESYMNEDDVPRRR